MKAPLEPLAAKPNKIPKPNLLYVDEFADERDNFVTDAIDTELFGTVHALEPKRELPDMLADLLECNFDALVSDYNLSEGGPVNYTGEELVSAYLNIRPDFPCFIRTSYEGHALAKSSDVNRVYSKGNLEDAHSKSPFFERITIQVQHHRLMLENWKNELLQLLPILDSEDVNAKAVERIVELDTLIEQYFGSDSAVPANIKGNLLKKQHELLIETERLIADIEHRLGEAD